LRFWRGKKKKERKEASNAVGLSPEILFDNTGKTPQDNTARTKGEGLTI